MGDVFGNCRNLLKEMIKLAFKFLHWLRQNVTKEQFKTILNATDEDIKFNRLAFGKRTSQMQYVNICSRTAQTVIKAGIQ
jgi:hypothetical protein